MDLPFPPVTKAHIVNCAVHKWHPKYKNVTPKTRIIPLSRPFVEYLRADGIVLPEDDAAIQQTECDSDSGFYSSDNVDTDDEPTDTRDVAAEWRETHDRIKATIAELGGVVLPKLNWSAPKDATWMNATNSMECRSPDDIYLLLKSSDFVTHDLEHAFDGCVNTPECSLNQADISYHLVLRKHFQLNPAFEFRCFVRNRRLICLCQRDLNHHPLLFKIRDKLCSTIRLFFETRLRDTFEDDDFVFDCYVPAPHDKVWLIDINPWDARTDPILFGWLEILTMDEPGSRPREDQSPTTSDQAGTRSADDTSAGDSSDAESDVDEEIWSPELRLINPGDPETSLATPQYSAHKLPRDVVEASQNGESLLEFAKDWQNILARRQQTDAEHGDSESE
ncbi:hypothetical protein BAUCODRAFT_24004 [Baudoinia panamericana UAMH 10762]|uniref:Uncharacterized protein n=1 Tax=Baudoinia panamericana (strain UAMH 10762) TaxID=717646 RepID=M2MHS0_BAUPA|nr:uncharacterized protein BAUCODRAFT_24004 [Baudoinia panamericana UAMH 10762]EMC96171.1 hypothetical protein BAUCODRAFT_24004 [Baudoinia panamericana UAMH 10762]